MDGTYVPESAIVEGETIHFLYSTTQISCKGKRRIIKRNQKKSKLIDHLLSIQDIEGIPYRGYYMSSNLDHALYNCQNLDDEQKKQYADAFWRLLRGKETLLVDFLEDEAANGVPDSFPASWSFIKKELHSLERHTNLHIYFKENPYQ